MEAVLQAVPGVEQAGEQGEFHDVLFAEEFLERREAGVVCGGRVPREGGRPADHRLFALIEESAVFPPIDYQGDVFVVQSGSLTKLDVVVRSYLAVVDERRREDRKLHQAHPGRIGPPLAPQGHRQAHDVAQGFGRMGQGAVEAGHRAPSFPRLFKERFVIASGVIGYRRDSRHLGLLVRRNSQRNVILVFSCLADFGGRDQGGKPDRGGDVEKVALLRG